MDTIRAMEYGQEIEPAFLEAFPKIGRRQASVGHGGVALVMVLWVVALLSVVVLEFAFAMRTETTIARNHGDSIKAYYVARGGFQYGLVEIIRWLSAQKRQTLPFLITRRTTINLNPQESEDQKEKRESLWRTDGRLYQVVIAGGGCRIRIQDEGGKIDINQIPDRQLRKVIGSMGLDSRTRDAVVDSILDWRDENQLHRANGAEEPYYQSLPEPYSCKDGLIDILEELLLVKGVTREIFYGGRIGTTMAASMGPRQHMKGPGLVDIFTVYASRGRVNINTAPKAVLETIPGIGPQRASSIIRAREKAEFRSIQELQSHLGQEAKAAEEFLGISPSNFFTIYSEGEMETGVCRAVRAVVRVAVGRNPSYKIVQWDDDAEIIRMPRNSPQFSRSGLPSGFN